MVRKAKESDVDDLQWALRLSDHRRKAKQVIKEELLSRGITEAEVASWAPPKRDLRVPLSEPVAVSWPMYLQTMQRRRRAFRVTRYSAFALLTFVPFETIGRATQDLRDQSPVLLVIGSVRSVGLILAVLLVAFAVAAAYYTRTHNLRILLLRPFGQRRLSIGLRRIVINQFGFFGNVFTLSDRNYRPSLILEGIGRLADFGFIVLGPIFRRSPRSGRVKNERTFLNLARTLHKRFWPSFRSFVVGDQAANIKSHNQWWHFCVDLLMNSSEVIIMDVSHVGVGSEWEIAHLDRRGLVSDCIFIAQKGYDDVGVEALKRILEGRPVPRVFLYVPSGEFLEPDALNIEVQRRVLRALSAGGAATSLPPGLQESQEVAS